MTQESTRIIDKNEDLVYTIKLIFLLYTILEVS